MSEAWITDAAHSSRGTGEPDEGARDPISLHGLPKPRLNARRGRSDFDAGGGESMAQASTRRDESLTRRGSAPLVVKVKSFQHATQEGCSLARTEGRAGHRLAQYHGPAQELTEGPLGFVLKNTQQSGPVPSRGQPLHATNGMLIGTVLDEFARTKQATALVTKCAGERAGIATLPERI